MQNAEMIADLAIRATTFKIHFSSGTYNELEKKVKKDVPYMPALEADLWKIEAFKEFTEAKFDNSILPNFTIAEIDDIRKHISTC